jgi:hypothetical protein
MFVHSFLAAFKCLFASETLNKKIDLEVKRLYRSLFSVGAVNILLTAFRTHGDSKRLRGTLRFNPPSFCDLNQNRCLVERFAIISLLAL